MFTVPYFSNGKLILAVLFSAAVTAAAILIPALQTMFSTVMLSPAELLTALCFSFAVPAAAACTGRHGTKALRQAGRIPAA